jgi:CHASE3 domain sensor protein
VENERRRALILAAVYAVIVIGLLTGGGLYVRSLIGQSFRTASDLAATRALAYSSLRYMLDEETGIRGFEATKNPLFLEPYNEALKPFPSTVAQLRADVADFYDPTATAAVDDIIAINGDYRRTVAQPLLTDPGADVNAIEKHGKALVDRFRADVATIDTVITQRENLVNAEVQQSTDRIGILTGAAIVIVLLISLLYAVQQAALAERVERERALAADQRRETDVLRAA